MRSAPLLALALLLAAGPSAANMDPHVARARARAEAEKYGLPGLSGSAWPLPSAGTLPAGSTSSDGPAPPDAPPPSASAAPPTPAPAHSYQVGFGHEVRKSCSCSAPGQRATPGAALAALAAVAAWAARRAKRAPH